MNLKLDKESKNLEFLSFLQKAAIIEHLHFGELLIIDILIFLKHSSWSLIFHPARPSILLARPVN